MEGGATNTMADVITAITTGFTSVSTNAMTVIADIIPIAMGLFAAVWIVRKAVKWFKGMTN